MNEEMIEDLKGREISVYYKDKEGNKIERTDTIKDIKLNKDGTYDIIFKSNIEQGE